MTDINKVIIVGRLTNDQNLSYTTSGMAIGKFSIAVNRTRTNASGIVEQVSYFNCEIFGKLAETLQPYMHKGKQVIIAGYLNQNRWKKDGQSHSMVTIGVDEIELVGKKEENGGYNNSSYDNGYDGGYNNGYDYS